MSKERELLRHALNFLERTSWDNDDVGDIIIVIKNIEQLLAQPEQEPVAWRWKKTSGWAYQENENNGGEPLYTSTPKREPLSDDEIDLGYQASCGNYYDLAFKDGVQFAEKYHKIGVDDV